VPNSLRQNVVLAFAGIVFLAAGFRDLYRPGFLTLNAAVPSRTEVGVAMALGLMLIGIAAFRITKLK
jgi:hypothetical protein